MAALVEACLEDSESVMELDWDDADVRTGFAEFGTVSLLHRYIYGMIAVEHRHMYRKEADLYEEYEEDINAVEALLDEYGIKHLPYASFAPPIPIDKAASRAEYPFYQWFLSQEASFESLWERLADECFHLLFANRSFLLRFNLAIAEYVRSHPEVIPTSSRDAGGRLQRRRPPTWARRAIFYRDQGRCVLCQVDLSGLLSTDRIDHFDHIVPLADWGTNDACNLQLLCAACNLRKAAGEAITSARYSAWWRY